MGSYPVADVECVLKVHIHCEACRMKLLSVLKSISGVYSVIIDAEEGLAKISGEVDPNILLSSIAQSGKHAELKWVKLNSSNHYTGGTSYNNYNDISHYYGGHGPTINDSYYYYRSRRRPRVLMPTDEEMWHDTFQNYYYSPPQMGICPVTDQRIQNHNQLHSYTSSYGGYLPPDGGAHYKYY